MKGLESYLVRESWCVCEQTTMWEDVECNRTAQQFTVLLGTTQVHLILYDRSVTETNFSNSVTYVLSKFCQRKSFSLWADAFTSGIV